MMVCCVCEGPTDGICDNCESKAILKAATKLQEKYNLSVEEITDIWNTIYGELGPWYWES